MNTTKTRIVDDDAYLASLRGKEAGLKEKLAGLEEGTDNHRVVRQHLLGVQAEIKTLPQAEKKK